MAEVYTISGSSFGQAACPVGWATTPNGNCGAPLEGCPPEMRVAGACRSEKAVALQNALRHLGNATGDSALKAIAVDGLIGPKTTAAANRALQMYAARANPRFRTGALTQMQVANEAALIASITAAESATRGVPVGPPPPLPKPRAVPAPVPVPMPTPMAYPRALWALVGLNALAAATGVYMGVIEPGTGRRRMPARAYATAGFEF